MNNNELNDHWAKLLQQFGKSQVEFELWGRSGFTRINANLFHIVAVIGPLTCITWWANYRNN